MALVPLFDDAQLESICKVLADTRTGLTGTEITRLLRQCGITDTDPTISKWQRLYNALCQRQNQDRCGNHVALFIETAMAPARYVKTTDVFVERRSDLNEALSFCGISVGEDGKLRKGKTAHTLDEASARADRLRKALRDRGVHADVLRFCRAELLQSNCFHAVFEATKSVSEKIRTKSNLTTDGSDLVDKAFGLGESNCPVLAFNSLQTETERSEHRGLMNLIKGIFGVFRNVTAHAPRITWTINEQDALDLFVLASFIHRRLDGTVVVPKAR